ncbi:MAG: hypothetical protein WA057_03585 [Candidatus Magasanikiibacteriota bacterium]
MKWYTLLAILATFAITTACGGSDGGDGLYADTTESADVYVGETSSIDASQAEVEDNPDSLESETTPEVVETCSLPPEFGDDPWCNAWYCTLECDEATDTWNCLPTGPQGTPTFILVIECKP